jgi:hypothetical protein
LTKIEIEILDLDVFWKTPPFSFCPRGYGTSLYPQEANWLFWRCLWICSGYYENHLSFCLVSSSSVDSQSLRVNAMSLEKETQQFSDCCSMSLSSIFYWIYLKFSLKKLKIDYFHQLGSIVFWEILWIYFLAILWNFYYFSSSSSCSVIS